MSGSGGMVYNATPFTGPCESLTFRTVLNSPVPRVIAKLTSQWVKSNTATLEVSQDNRGGLQIAVALFEGDTVGAITADALMRLLECMQAGNEYVAEVKNISGARVEVQVMRK